MVKISSLALALLIASVASVASAAQNDDAITSFRIEIATTPASAPAIIARTLRAAGPQAPALAGPIAEAAVENVGVNPSKKQITAVVFATVHAVPGSVLEIVRAAVIASPKSAAAIAAAAASAVPNPWKQVIYQKQQTAAASAAALMPTAVGKPMTLAEAIVQAAFDAESGTVKVTPVRERDFKGERDFKDGAQAFADPEVPLAAIQEAVDAALVGDPGALLSQVSDPKSISAVGDPGGSNFGNEPKLRTPKPRVPPTVPDPPPVSQ